MENKDLQLFYAKQAIFRLISQFCQAVADNSGVYWVSNYCQGALESAFSVLGIKEDRITLKDFCQKWENNEKMIWIFNNSDKEYDGITAQIFYDCFPKLRKGDYCYD